MPTEADLLSRKVLVTLADGPMSRDALLDRLIPMVAPGKALRRYEDRRLAQIRKKMRQPPKPPGRGGAAPLDETGKIRSGAKAIVGDRIGSLIHSGKIVRTEDGLLALGIPECPRCALREPLPAPDELLDPRDLAMVLDFADQCLMLAVKQGKMTPGLWMVQARTKKMRRLVVDALLEAYKEQEERAVNS